MKKNIFLFVCLFFAVHSFAQIDTICGVMPMKDGKVLYSEVIPADNLSANQLYSNAKIWAGSTFEDYQEVVQSDVENTSLTLKGNTSIDESTIVKFTLTIQFKDHKFKYILTDFIYRAHLYDYKYIEKPLENTQGFASGNPCERVILEDKKIRIIIKQMVDKIKLIDNW